MEYIESYTTELKEIVSADIKKEIIAFANADGGDIYAGITKHGTVIGVENAELEMERISNMIRDGIKPDLTGFTLISLIRDNGKDILKISVSRGSRRPYHLSDRGLKPSGVYIRHGITSAPASDEMIRQMIKESDGTSFDKLRSINQDLTFLYTERYFKEKNVSFEDYNKRTLGLIDSDGYFTNAALLLSDQCEHSIKCAVFKGTDKMYFRARNELKGSIFEQMENALLYVDTQNNKNTTFEGLYRIDNLDYPEEAIREALLNAVVHRDYDYSGSTIINIYDDRMEFVSLGGLAKGVTFEDIMIGISQSRNTVIANIFYRLELIESYGTGIRRIVKSYEGCENQPVFNHGPASFIVTLPNRTISFEQKVKKVKEKMSSEDQVLELFHSNKEVTRNDVQELLGCSAFPATKILNSLINKDLIEKIGSARSTRYILKNNSELETANAKTTITMKDAARIGQDLTAKGFTNAELIINEILADYEIKPRRKD